MLSRFDTDENHATTQDGKRHKVLALPPNSTGLQVLDAALRATADDPHCVPCWRACVYNELSVSLINAGMPPATQRLASLTQPDLLMWQGIVSLNTLSTMTGFRSRTHMTVIVTGLAECPAQMHLL